MYEKDLSEKGSVISKRGNYEKQRAKEREGSDLNESADGVLYLGK